MQQCGYAVGMTEPDTSTRTRRVKATLSAPAVPPQRTSISDPPPDVPVAVEHHGFVSVQARGTVALPPKLRRRFGLDQPGSQVEITERGDGVLELRPVLAVPASQAWFWTDEWQAGERQVDADIAAGRETTFDDVDDFMTHLDELGADQ